jgi:hypothetical protein
MLSYFVFLVLTHKICMVVSTKLLGKIFIEMRFALQQRDIASPRGHTPEKSIRELLLT